MNVEAIRREEERQRIAEKIAEKQRLRKTLVAEYEQIPKLLAQQDQALCRIMTSRYDETMKKLTMMEEFVKLVTASRR